MIVHRNTSRSLVCFTTLLFSSSVLAEEPAVYSPYVADDFPQSVYWGDAHLHTNVSFDAYGDGNIKRSPDDAYRFAKGEVTEGHDGVPVRISRPLDWLVIADHSEYMGVIQRGVLGDKLLDETEAGARWAQMAKDGKLLELYGEMVNDAAINEPRELSPALYQSIWGDVGQAAERHNDPGRFTAFIGYEYSSLPDGDNLHRVVIFADGPDKTNQVVPFSLFDSENPEDLWDYLEAYEKKTGGRVMAIPHNGNTSAGRMFASVDFEGKPLSLEYAQKRAKWETIVETTQIKGDSETHPNISPDDEFADFERWDKGNLILLKLSDPELMPYEYSRSALQLGLMHEQNLGANPFKFGMIGATDSHTSFGNAEEDNFLGKYGVAYPSADRWKKVFPPDTVPGILDQWIEWQSSQSGLAGVWAVENTREAIFDALRRKEVYATTGPRMSVRAFGGFGFTEADALRNDLARVGYQKGVPMGGDVSGASEGEAFSMLVSALKDPDGANLDRVQIIKGWVDADGERHERIYDVAVSDGRTIDASGRCKQPVGSTVDVATATYENSIGDVQFTAAWTDPDFDPDVRAVYYVRVIEIPTPRWTLYDTVRLGAEMPEEAPMVLQERAYTSPIWYTPGG